MSYQKVELALSKLIHLYPTPVRFLVAFSGGLDSTVLLDALCKQVSPKIIKAVYINHGLQAESAQWSDSCAQFCHQLGVPFESIDVQVSETARQGVEAVARLKRYDALYNKIKDDTILLTAHHQRDQAETLLLNLARGAGISGLSGMPYQKEIKLDTQVIQHCRPLLEVGYESIQDYASHYQLNWVEDPSNQAVDYRRNYLRHEVLPKIRQAWPFSDASFAKSAQNLGESLTLLNELAEMDLKDSHYSNFCLSYDKVKVLGWPRLKNLTRYWARFCSPSLKLNAKIYQWLESCLDNENPQAKPKMILPQGVLRFYNHTLFHFVDLNMDYCETLDQFDATALQFFKSLSFAEQLSSDHIFKMQDAIVRPLKAEDLSSELQKKALKKWFKMNKVPDWDRQRWPVLEKEGQVIAILGFYAKESF